MYDCGEGARRHDHNHPHRVSGHSHADDNQYTTVTRQVSNPGY